MPPIAARSLLPNQLSELKLSQAESKPSQAEPRSRVKPFDRAIDRADKPFDYAIDLSDEPLIVDF